jgi:hypothetical protein
MASVEIKLNAENENFTGKLLFLDLLAGSLSAQANL